MKMIKNTEKIIYPVRLNKPTLARESSSVHYQICSFMIKMRFIQELQEIKVFFLSLQLHIFYGFDCEFGTRFAANSIRIFMNRFEKAP
jgi:hypothetical protein